MYIYHAAGFVDAVAPERESLKPRLKALGAGALRRAGRFNQLAVLGAASCAEGITLPADCDVMVASVAGHVSDSAAVLGDAIVKHQSPMPFAFMNTQGNSACYNVAKVLGLDGNSSFILHPDAPFESALMLAGVRPQLSSAKLLMLGLVEEWTLPYYQSPSGYRGDDQAVAFEGSCWFVIGEDCSERKPIGRILAAEVTLNEVQVRERLHRLELAGSVRWELCSQAQLIWSSEVPNSLPVNTPCHESIALVSWLQKEASRYFCRIRANRTGGYRWSLLERY